MKSIKIYQVDAFTDHLFGGNPAAVCLLENRLEPSQMQAVAAENNLAETAFVTPVDGSYEIRWFTPTVEVELCGHATLASAFVLFDQCGFSRDEIVFRSLYSGELRVRRSGSTLFLDFPADVPVKIPVPDGISGSIGIIPVAMYRGKSDFMAVVRSESEVRNIRPDFDAIGKLDARGLIVTAPGDEVDFVSRFFGPQSGINEDPVTGSAHTTLTPYWSERLGKMELTARQVSSRGGNLICHNHGDRIIIGGEARLYLSGEIFI